MGAYPAYKRDYDAMVFIDGTDVVAIDSDGSVIDHGTAGTDDSTVIQAAIDNVPSKGKLIIGPGTYIPSSYFEITSSIDIVGYGKPVFQWYAPAPVALFYCSGSPYTEDMLHDDVSAGDMTIKTTSDLTSVISTNDLVGIYDANIWNERSSLMSPTGTITASGSAVGNTPEYSIDNELSTYWRSDAVTGWLQYDFGAGQTIRKYGVYGVKDSADNPYSWVLQGSNDALAWADIDTQTGVTWAKSERKFYILTDQTYQYYRLNITANNGGVNLDVHEWEVYDENTGHHYYDAWKVGELHSVLSVESDKINIREGLLHDYGKEPLGGYVVPIVPISVSIDGIRIEGDNPQATINSMAFLYCQNVSVTNCEFECFAGTAISATRSYNVSVDSCLFRDSTGVIVDAYCVVAGNATAHLNFTNSFCDNTRNAFQAGGGVGWGQARDLHITNGQFSKCIGPSVVGCHGNVESIYIDGCIMKGYMGESTCGVITGARETYVSNCKIYDMGLAAVTTSWDTKDRIISVVGNYLYRVPSGLRLVNTNVLVNSVKHVLFSNNICVATDCDYGFIYNEAIRIESGIVSNNVISNSGVEAISFNNATNVNIVGNTIMNCNRRDAASAYIELIGTSNNCVIQNNILSDYDHLTTSQYAVKEGGSANKNTVINNTILMFGTSPILLIGDKSVDDYNHIRTVV